MCVRVCVRESACACMCELCVCVSVCARECVCA